MYDYIIVGAGPTGLTLALYLAKLNKKIIVIEKENTIGGIHRVKRENGLFTEHGPRIYLNNLEHLSNNYLQNIIINYYLLLVNLFKILTLKN